MAFVRVKRRLQDDPKEVLLLTSSKKPKTETAVFKFAATVDKQKFQGRDAFYRMNYLYQIANLCSNIPGAGGKKLMLHYGAQMTVIGKKTNSRMEPELKRTICKGCNAILVPGDTARVRLLSKPQPQVVWICIVCGTYKLFNTRPGYKLWCEKSEALIETLGCAVCVGGGSNCNGNHHDRVGNIVKKNTQLSECSRNLYS
ncbi:hypothetical protein AAG570_001441 [Ranatra chinensis]|uniref:Uncharacterized protein n=1 Tax=Ranatra chinensis TaxID=642074 RepID=A0ABD0YBW4_9HEMI